jgi:hypothetical protein
MGLKAVIPLVLGFLKEAPTYRNKMFIPRPGVWTNLHVLQKK